MRLSIREQPARRGGAQYGVARDFAARFPWEALACSPRAPRSTSRQQCPRPPARCMPAGNRQSTAPAQHALWQSAIGSIPTWPGAQRPSAEASAEAAKTQYESMKGLLQLAKMSQASRGEREGAGAAAGRARPAARRLGRRQGPRLREPGSRRAGAAAAMTDSDRQRQRRQRQRQRRGGSVGRRGGGGGGGRPTRREAQARARARKRKKSKKKHKKEKKHKRSTSRKPKKGRSTSTKSPRGSD